MASTTSIPTIFFSSRLARSTAFFLLLGLGIAIRLFDMTDLPLDFHATRQLHSALIARGMYYQTLTNVPADHRSFAIEQWKSRASVEPTFFERFVAWTYAFTGEQLWVARLYSILFWCIAGIFLFLFARELSSHDGALAALAVYLFLPYGVIASRSFQPDPLMVMLIVIFWWAVYRWVQTIFSNQHTTRAWAFAIIAGAFGGLAIFIKFVAAFFVIGGGLGALLGREPLRATLRRPQLYVMAALGALPGAAYLIYGTWIAGYLGQQFSGRFIPSYLLSPSYYLGWVGTLNLVIGAGMLMCALLGLFFFQREALRFALGLWAAYALFGIFFDYHIASHDYYSLPLIPIVALSIAPIANYLLARLSQAAISKPLVAIVLLFGLFASLWNTRAQLKSIDYRPQAQFWAQLSAKIGDHSVAGLTQDYGQRLAYWGWKNIVAWPTSGDLNYHDNLRGAQHDFENQFDELASKKELFVVTDFDELKLQPFLQQKLQNYPVFAQGDGYIIYSLGIPSSP